MIRRDLVDMYCVPEDYRPPQEAQLQSNTQYPNLNSEEYRRKFSVQNLDFGEFYEILTKNASDNSFLVVTNDYRCGSLTIIHSYN